MIEDFYCNEYSLDAGGNHCVCHGKQVRCSGKTFEILFSFIFCKLIIVLIKFVSIFANFIPVQGDFERIKITEDEEIFCLGLSELLKELKDLEVGLPSCVLNFRTNCFAALQTNINWLFITKWNFEWNFILHSYKISNI